MAMEGVKYKTRPQILTNFYHQNSTKRKYFMVKPFYKERGRKTSNCN